MWLFTFPDSSLTGIPINKLAGHLLMRHKYSTKSLLFGKTVYGEGLGRLAGHAGEDRPEKRN